MAAGDITLFNQFGEDEGAGVHDFDNDTFKVCVLDNTTPPTAADAAPAYSAYSSNEVSGTNYTAGGATLANVVWSRTGDTTKFDADDAGWTQNAAGPTDMYWGVVYNDSDASKRGVCFVELGGPLSLQDGDVTIQWGAGGIATKQVNV